MNVIVGYEPPIAIATARAIALNDGIENPPSFERFTRLAL